MNHSPEEILSQLTPRGASRELREQVLRATGEVLAARPKRWDLWCGAAAAASLLIGMTLNVWAIRHQSSRSAELFGPESLPRNIVLAADAVESMTDPETGRWVRDQWQIARRSRQRSTDEGIASFRHSYQFICNELATAHKEPPDVEENDPMDRNRPDRHGGDTTGLQRDLDLRDRLAC